MVACEHHLGRAVRCVKVVDIDVLLVSYTSEHVASMRELNFSAALDRMRLESID